MKYLKFILLTLGVVGFMASCQCKKCTRDGLPSQTFCKDQGSQDDYDNAVEAFQNNGYTCN